MTSEIERRQQYSEQRIQELRSALDRLRDKPKDVCIYVIGSYGRGEASESSDLDVFIVGRSHRPESGSPARMLSKTDETLLKADLIRCARNCQFPEFSGDGEWVKHHAFHELVDNTGTQHDDYENTLTERVLLLLESRPLMGDDVYNDLIREVLEKYWCDFEGHEDCFRPMFLVNDIIRLWRTFCVNYEAHTKREPQDKKASRQLKHFKLQHSRLLTCYSALLAMLAEYDATDTVTLDRAQVLFARSPIDRIRDLSGYDPSFTEKADQLLRAYEQFLVTTGKPKDEIIDQILREGRRIALPEPSPSLGDAVYDLLQKVGNGCDFHRMIVV